RRTSSAEPCRRNHSGSRRLHVCARRLRVAPLLPLYDAADDFAKTCRQGYRDQLGAMGKSEEDQEDRERISESGVAAARASKRRRRHSPSSAHRKKTEMNVDFSNSRNATILRYLQNPYDFIMGPKTGLFRE